MDFLAQPVSSGAATQKSEMPYACMSCTRLKIKCDRSKPCSNCHKRHRNCDYQAAAPRRLNRKNPQRYHRQFTGSDDVSSPGTPSLRRDAGPVSLLELASPPLGGSPRQFPLTGQANPQLLTPKTTASTTQPDTDDTEEITRAHLLRGFTPGNSRYIDSTIWSNLGEDSHPLVNDEAEVGDHQTLPPSTNSHLATTAFIGIGPPKQSLLESHPSYENAIKLWKFYVRDIGYIVHLVHMPSTFVTLQDAATRPGNICKATEALIFAIYHMVLTVINDAECQRTFGKPKSVLQRKYHDAAEQALVNANFIRTTELPVLQAYIMFLVSVRDQYDSYLFWILTGIAIRIAQKMGLDRTESEKNINPFDEQMRRRLWWQLVPLDNFAAQLSGMSGISVSGSWNAQSPMNINDEDIWPNMTEIPKQKKGATDMIFFLTRVDICKCLRSKSQVPRSDDTSTSGTIYQRNWKMWNARGFRELQSAIQEIEDHFEENYIRYCDYMNPLHAVAMYHMRLVVCSLRLRLHLERAKSKSLSTADRKQISSLATTVLKYDITSHNDITLSRHLWHLDGFFQLDPLIWILHELCHEQSMLPVAETWEVIQQTYECHPELTAQKRALHLALGRVMLKAWRISRKTGMRDEPEPACIGAIQKTFRLECDTLSSRPNSAGIVRPEDTAGMDHDLTYQFQMMEESDDSTNYQIDWAFWDQLLQDSEPAQGSAQW